MNTKQFKVGLAAVLILGIVALFFVVNAFAQSASETLNCPSGLVSVIDVEEGMNVECVNAPFATLTPTTGAPTDTPIPPTDTPEPGHDPLLWHPPTNHEHGDSAPDWADSYSIANFGHPVIYGGDEATPGENVHKHEAFKGFYGILEGDEVFIRIHGFANPVGRAGGAGKGRYHSFELYVKEGETGEISFIQGWPDFGQHPEDRDLQGTGENSAAMKFAAEGHVMGACETWYARLGSAANGQGFYVQWMPDLIYQFCEDIVAFHYIENEYATFEQMDEWPNVGLNLGPRTIKINWYSSRIPPSMRGATTLTTQFGDPVSGPDDPLCSEQREAFGVTYDILCLPQSVAESFDGIKFPNANLGQVIDCPDCVMPN